MKEHGDKCSTTTRGLPPSAHISSDKLIRDQELRHLVTSSIPSPPYAGLSLINASAALTVFGDPIYSSHLFASLAANNANVRFQLPIPIPMALQPTANPHPHHQHHHQGHIFHPLAGATVPGFAGIPGATVPSQAQLDILSSWVNEQARKDDQKITSTTPTTNGNVINNNKISSSNKSKRNNNVDSKNNKNAVKTSLTKQKRSANGNGNLSITKTNRKNKTGRNNGAIISSSENELLAKKEKFEKDAPEPMNIHESIIQPLILPLDKSPVGSIRMDISQSPPIKSEKLISNLNGRAESPPGVNNNNNHNGVSKNGNQTSPGSNGPRDKVFTCPTCNRCFGYKHVLQNHERTHTGEKPFECNICMKKFTRDHHLKTHMRLHTGEKPYQCTHCDRQFVQVANLRRHLRVHTGERPYACELCSSRFSDSNQLKAHMLIHKGEKPYSCTECGGKFRRRHHLAHHKCVEDGSNKRLVFHPASSSSPDTSPPQLTPGNVADSLSNGNGSIGKRERKCRETRRIIRLESVPGTTETKINPLTYLADSVVPEQTVPEDLSMGGTTIRSRNYSGSSSSVTASSPSPRSGVSHGSFISGPYCYSNTSSETPDLYSDEDRAADSSTNGKNESSSDDILSPSHE
ncbi:unnamed protein product [Orchesella dallaii]|uniref:C2H2-type domain-containing protein n=1 Tax=Orchesella dallaii TaxID=48710 RepID=A0ABP1QIM8_9HEXA